MAHGPFEDKPSIISASSPTPWSAEGERQSRFGRAAAMLAFEEQVVADLVEDPNGGLVVLSSGFPLASLAAALLLQLHLHHRPGDAAGGGGCLLVLSAPDPLKARILRRLQDRLQVLDVPPDLPAQQRASLYASGAALFLSPRALAADLLTSRLHPSHVRALLLLSAHRSSDTSSDSFIARLLRQRHLLPVYAFSDRPHAMVAGFSKAERAMKSLYVRRLHLWPRFHVLAAADLERAPPDVVDVRVPMTPAMRGIQAAVLAAMDACLKELRRTNKVDVEDLTVDKGLFKSFDEIVRRQLDPIWHTLGKKTKQLVADLRTLRKLLDYLVRYDAVTYLKYLDTLRVSEGVRSVWILADSSHKIFELAKRRVYQVVRADGIKVSTDKKGTPTKKRKVAHNSTDKGKEYENEDSTADKHNTQKVNADAGIVLDEVLEEAPKWKVLQELLQEIAEEQTKGDGENAQAEDESGIVLVTCKDERTCFQLQECISKGPHKDGRCIGPTLANEPDPLLSQNSITRKAGGKKTPEKEMQVIVDMREFMSSLPNVLHQKGIRIVPVTLEVGDYVLSPLICVERKSIADLFQSFASGRLYNQVDTMARYYKIPVLLIEFSQDKSFSFQSASEIGDDVSPTNIISKLSLLVLHFPRLRIVWSRSLHATVEIFVSLKTNQDEPDEKKAIRVGVPSEDGIVEDDVRAENYNTSAIEFLRRLPGVTDSNYRAIMDGCNSLAELALLPVEELTGLMGSQKGARTLKEFLDAKCPTML
ncbi:DNA repair endonuclease UVH1 isoform X2 [Setaria viridis]|uniref:DNA repair endonuclease UVH1 isoform X2 n=1 Tax=Setaria viridis TaxID=4556 RepID=UPI001493D086|nr:DNA repair endonuclease UVH1 isoform X2 [Setaria viridis]